MELKRLSAMVVMIVAAAWTLTASSSATGAWRLSPPGDGQLAGADLSRDGWALVAWKATEAQWSRVEVFENGSRRSSWDFEERLVKDARWVEPGKRMLLYSVRSDGVEGSQHGDPEALLYSIDSEGGLHLDWSSAALGRKYSSITPSQDGRFWLGTDFGVASAEVLLGRVGETEPLWTWQLTGDRLGRPTALDADQFSYAFFLEGSGDPPEIGILWGARLWLARSGSNHLVRAEPSEGCDEIYVATSTRAGIWVDCFRGIDTERPHSWALFPQGWDATASRLEPSLVEQFYGTPEFLADGTVLDRFSREGRAEVYRPTAAATELEHQGTLALPTEARIFVGGDALLVEDVESTEVFRVLSLSEEIEALSRPR